MRLAASDVINWRNNANSANLSLGVDATDVLTFNGTGISVGGSPVQTAITVSDTATIDMTLVVDNISADIVTGSITNTHINAAAAIAYSKLNLTGSIVNADVSGSAAIAYSKLSLSGSILNADISASAAIANSKLAQMATLTIKGNNTGGSATPSDLTGSQVTALLSNFVGDSGSGGTKGVVPAPAAGDAAAGKFLKADGSWVAPSGSGDVVGPASSTDNGFVKFNGTTGKLIKDSAATISNADVNAAAAITYSKLNLTGSIVNADINASAAIAYSKLSLTGSIVNADVGAAAAIAFSKLATLSSGNILVGNVSNVAASVAMSGAITIDNAGATTYNGTVPLNKGGTGQTTKTPAFDALSPMTTAGDIIYGGASGTGTRLAAGTSTQYLRGGTTPAWASFTQATVSVATTTSHTGGFSANGSGTYTTPAGCIRIEVQMVGGGGGGSGSGTDAGTVPTAATAGTASTFGTTLLSAGGGALGAWQAAGGVGGASSLGTGPVGIALPGGQGGTPTRYTVNSFIAPGASGGSSAFGGAGAGGLLGAGGAGGAATGGGGGSGSGFVSASAQSSGGGGGSGGYVNAIITSPSATYPYVVGPGGNAGGAGTSGSAGGAGGSGIIYVIEYYQ